jgi:hypothetical protein
MRDLVRQWTESDVQKLKELTDKGASVIRVSAALNRSQSSVKKMARQLGGELVSVRDLKAGHRKRLANAEKALRPGQRRNDGTYA